MALTNSRAMAFRIRSAKESVAASHTVLIVSRVMEMAIFGRSRIR
jgi:hypothetical protein